MSPGLGCDGDQMQVGHLAGAQGNGDRSFHDDEAAGSVEIEIVRTTPCPNPFPEVDRVKHLLPFEVDNFAVATGEDALSGTRPTDCQSCRIGDRVTAHLGGEDGGCPTLGA